MMLLEEPWAQLTTDGRTYVTYVDEEGWHTLQLRHVRPRKRQLVLRDYRGKHHAVPFDGALEIWQRPYRARKSQRIWSRPK